MKKNILIVEDNPVTQAGILKEVQKYPKLGTFLATGYQDANRVLRRERKNIHFAIVDLNLPDATEKQIVALMNAHRIPTIIFTGMSNPELRDLVFQKEVVDYVLKENSRSISYAIKRANQYLKRHERTLLIVDDSPVFRQVIKESLRDVDIRIMEAENGIDALKLIQKRENGISIIITDYNMPQMDGMELTMKIRSMYSRDEFAIIAASTIDQRETIKKFFKIGINDYIVKPFENDDVFISVQNALEILDLFEESRELANKDYLTGAYNRRYFFDAGGAIFDKNRRKQLPIAIGMVDVDHFKSVNDTYGHDVGDIALKETTAIVKESIRGSDLFARFGGEEFAILLEDIALEDAEKVMEKIRNSLESHTIVIDETLTLSCTLSIGLAYGIFSSLEEALSAADGALYRAKKEGRNRVLSMVSDPRT